MNRINLISGPRNISTAMMYSFAQRPDTTVLDEPFYAVYFLKSGVEHPGRAEVLADQPHTEAEVFQLIEKAHTREVIFVKNMAHHLEVLVDPQLDSFSNVFLIRNPHQIIASYSQVIQRPVMRDIGIEYQYKLFEQLNKDYSRPVVIDSGLLLENPERVMRQLCDSLGLPFQSAMMQWPAGPKSYDGVWAPYWYKNVHQSTGFAKQSSSNRSLRDDLKELYEQSMFYYEKLLPFAITP